MSKMSLQRKWKNSIRWSVIENPFVLSVQILICNHIDFYEYPYLFDSNNKFVWLKKKLSRKYSECSIQILIKNEE